MIPHPTDQRRMDTLRAYQATYVNWLEARRQRDLEAYREVSETARDAKRELKKAWKNHTRDCDEIVLSWKPGATEPWDPYAWSKFNWQKRPQSNYNNRPARAIIDPSMKDKEEAAQTFLNLSDMWQMTLATKKRTRSNNRQGELSKRA